eukprot:TRINITY_DN63370_c0_g1_i1.p1 TRINITY_DN63370_c0_g1~~TRINITY_DN63370_c0_g1_i1.p1  ORF type:complete len:689 (+),score=191.70 TRINITY_DN63370_c0_g1_i1:258-2324(+)
MESTTAFVSMESSFLPLQNKLLSAIKKCSSTASNGSTRSSRSSGSTKSQVSSQSSTTPSSAATSQESPLPRGISGSDIESDDVSDSESFCSALDTASDSELVNSDVEDMSRAVSETSKGCVFQVSLLLQLRAAMFCHYGPNLGAPLAANRLRAMPYEEPSSPCQASEPEPVAAKTAGLLPTSGNAWKPRARKGNAEDETATVTKAMRSILNKLTVEKFEALYEKLATCGIRTPEHLEILMGEVFEKATLQHHFISMYADLCVCLEADARITSAFKDGVEQKKSSFKRLLLNQCQSAFEQILEPETDTASSDEDEDPEIVEEKRMLRKKKSLGNVKLVGELLSRGMLHSQLLCGCCNELLQNRDEAPEAIESLTTLLTVASPKFDKNPDFSQQNELDKIFAKVAELAAPGSSLPPRLRFLLQDLLSLRKSGWPEAASRTAALRRAPAPMKIDEVRAADKSKSPSNSSVSSSTSAESNRNDRSKKNSKFPMAGKAKTSKSSAADADNSQRMSRLAAICSKGPAAARAPAPAARVEAVPAAPVVVSPTVRPASAPYDPAAFRKVLSNTLRELRVDRNAAAAVKKIRAENVPREHQAKEFADLIFRVAEDASGPPRRAAFAFIVSLCSAGDASAFDPKECFEGASLFFREEYEDLTEEVPRLNITMTAEFIPMLRSALASYDINSFLPKELQ